jgi:hypothetical protein
MGTVFFGAFAAVATGRYLDRTNKYRSSLKVEAIGVCIAYLASTYFFTTGTDWGALCFCFSAGITLTPSIPICFQLGCELTHPVQPALVTGLLMSMAQVMMIILNYVYLYFLVVLHKPDWVMFGFAAAAFIAFIASFFIKEELRRLSSVLDISIGSIVTPKLQYR